MSITNENTPYSGRNIRKVQWDYRLGGNPRLVFVTDEELMQIPNEIRKCVAFLACKRNSGYKTGGTVFFVGYPLAGIKDTFLVYAITARHVIEEISKRSDGNVYCRLNTKQHGIQYLGIPTSDWLYNDDPRIDVAIAQMSLDFHICDHLHLPLNMFINNEMIAKEEVGIGDDLFFPGLFTQRPGENANLPIVRIGNIAAMPEESIETKWGVLQPSYLVEARSIGGLSGSPVFWHRGTSRIRSGSIQIGGSAFFIIGLIHGHYGIKEDTWDFNDETSTDSTETRSLNMGIAIVIPASDILSTLNHPDLQQKREVILQGILATKRLSLPIPDVIAEISAETIIQEDVIARTEYNSDMSGYFSTDSIIIQPKNEDPPMNP
jgi:hypothetical protein